MAHGERGHQDKIGLKTPALYFYLAGGPTQAMRGGVKALSKMFSSLARKPSLEKKERTNSASDLQFPELEKGTGKEESTTERFEREFGEWNICIKIYSCRYC